MANPAPFEPVAGLLERTLSIKHVYGEPIVRGDRTVVPVAKVAFGFGAGGGEGRRGHAVDGGEAMPRQGQGGGGGGAVRMTPVGVLEIGPDRTRYLPLNPVTPLLAAAAFGLIAGWLASRQRYRIRA